MAHRIFGRVHAPPGPRLRISSGVLCLLTLITQGCEPPPDPQAPYPPSTFITGMSFDFATHRREAEGSDNWPMTWADDGHQYTSWGDGGGFGGTNSEFRVSLGFARVIGDARHYRGENLWGDRNNSSGAADFGGKSYGIAAIDGTLYAWVSPGSNTRNWARSRLHKSDDWGESWTATPVVFSADEDSLAYPAFIQFGRGYHAAPDRHVYMYAVRLRDTSVWNVQRPGHVLLIRTSRDAMEKPESYEIFSGLQEEEPRWSSSSQAGTPVFVDSNGILLVSALYVPELDRYLLVESHTEARRGNVGVFESASPWGPWRTVHYEARWGTPEIESTAFYWNFAPKWFDAEERTFTLIFTGTESNDSWNSVRGAFEVAGDRRR